jgi:hypothetical protein
MTRLKLCSILSVASLALLVSGCGGGNSIGHTTQTITFANPGTQTVGVPLALSAEASSDAAVALTSATPGVCTISGTTATFVTAGTCTIDASQSGNSTYAAASQVAQSFTVNPAIGPTTTIYIAGQAISTPPSNIANFAEVWKLTSGSPTATVTALSMPSGMISATTYAITASGSDVYVAGVAWNTNNDASAVLWVNGAPTILPSSMTISEAGAVAVSGVNVYVTGLEENTAGSGTAVLWVNGTATTLAPPSGMAYASAGGIAISGSDVYVAGVTWNTNSDESAVLWVNGAATLLPAPNGFVGNYWASGIAVSGGNVYVSGTTDPDVGNYTAISWVNGGTATTLPIPPGDSAGNYGTGGVTVSGSDVYVAGSGSNGTTGDTSAAYWLNSTPTTLPMPSTVSHPSYATSSASGIALSGSDVYAVGSVEDSTDGVGLTGAYWVNGGNATLLPMPSGTMGAQASAITVVTQ